MKNKQRAELAVCGFAAVQALARQNPQKIKRFYYTRERAPAFGFLCKELASRKIPYNEVQDAQELEKLSGSHHHQGLTAMIEMPVFLPVGPSDVDEWSSRGETVLVLDGIGNAQNAGAIIRSAAFFGIQRIVLPADSAASLITTSSYRNAQGGMEFVRLYAVHSIPVFLRALKGKLLRVGTDAAGSQSVRDIKNEAKNDVKIGCAVILGNEENGMTDEVKKLCDRLVRIPSHNKRLARAGGAFPDSLNVAQAAAVILYELST